MKAGEIKKGNVIEHNGTVYQVRDIERSSPQGRGGNVKYRFTMYSVPGGNKLDLNNNAFTDWYEKHTGIHIQWDFRPHLPPVPMDQEQIHQVILNIAINAIHELVRDAGNLVALALDNAQGGHVDSAADRHCHRLSHGHRHTAHRQRGNVGAPVIIRRLKAHLAFVAQLGHLGQQQIS